MLNWSTFRQAASAMGSRRPPSIVDSSPLELFHPNGHVRSSLTMGGDCTDRTEIDLHSASIRPHGQDLILLTQGFLDHPGDGCPAQAVETLAQTLAADGVAYVLVLPSWRRRIEGLLDRHDLEVDSTIAHVPTWAGGSLLIPFYPAAIQYAVSDLIQGPAWKRGLAPFAVRLPGSRRFIRSFLPSIGLVVRHRGAPPLFSWLFELDREDKRPGPVILHRSWKGKQGSLILYRFSQNQARPAWIAKVTNKQTAASNLREAQILAQLGSSARQSGARVPQLLGLDQVNDRSVLLQSPLNGKPAAAKLCRKPELLPAILNQVMSWLEGWNHSTKVLKTLNPERLISEILAPAFTLEPNLQAGKAYLEWLTQLCARAAGTQTYLVAVHSDLTVWNILQDDQGSIGVIDWEAGQQEGFLLLDFFYTLVDAVAATQGYSDRLRAFKACFAPEGEYQAQMATLLQQFCKDFMITDHLTELFFHACWIHHAANEQETALPGDPTPFLQIVQWMAAHRPCLPRG